MEDEYYQDVYKLRDEIWKLRFQNTAFDERDYRVMFDAGFDAMLEIIEKEIAFEERKDLKLNNDKLC